MAMRDDGPAPAGRERLAHREHPARRSAPGQQRAAGRPAPGPARQSVRIGDAERDTATAELGDHYAAGRLTLDELHERVTLALSARTRGQLTRVMRDLPSLRRERPLPGPAPGEPLLSDGQPPGSADASRDGRFAAIGLLLLAMLIWLFTVVMFTRHGYHYHYHYHHYPHHPYSPWNHP
jgi:Domain of unknown function (DUF1707)